MERGRVPNVVVYQVSIPRRLYHIWLSDQPESEVAQQCMKTWPLLNFDVEHITLENCDRSEPFVRQALDCGTIEGRVKANDFLRVKYLYENGGVYLDNDVEVLKPFDDLMDYRCFLGAEDSQIINMAVLGAMPGADLLTACLDRMRWLRGDGPESPVAVSLGIVTDILKRRGWSDPTKRFHDNGLFGPGSTVVLASHAFYPVHWTQAPSLTGHATDSYTIHHWNMSWNQTVSVIVPCFNYGHYLAECLESVKAQTYPHIETIIIDDGSTDNTREVAARFPWARYVHQANRGLSGARNVGIRLAKGQFIQPLDADDRLDPTAIAKAVAAMDGADIVCPGQQEFDGSNRFYRRAGWPLDLQTFLQGNRIHCASMFRRKAWALVGGYDEGMKDGYEDWDFWIRLIAAGYSKIRVIDEPLFFYRVHRDSMLRQMGPKAETVKAYMREKYRRMGLGAANLVVAP